MSVVSASQLYREFSENEVAAEKKYAGFFKTVVVAGQVENVGKNIEGDTYLAFGLGEYEINSVQCFFGFFAKSKLESVVAGQIVRVECKVEGMQLGNLVLKSCKLLSP